MCKIPNLDSELITCQQTLDFVTSQINIITAKDSSLKHLINHSPSRAKRGIFNGLGTAWKWLTGSLDANASYYDKILAETDKTDKEIQILMKDQIQVIKSTTSTTL